MYQVEVLPNKQVKVVRYKPYHKGSDKRAGKESAHKSNNDKDSSSDN